MDLDELEMRILNISPTLPADDMAQLDTDWTAAKLKMSLNDAEFKTRYLRWLEANGHTRKHPFQVGRLMRWAADKIKRRCHDKAKAVERILTERSLEDLVEVMAAQPFKFAAVRDEYPQVYTDCFTEETERTIDGKVVKEIASMPEEMMR